MEPVRTKRRVVLMVVFSLALGILPACTPREGDKPAADKKNGPASAAEEKKTDTPQKTLPEMPTAAESKESQSQTEGGGSEVLPQLAPAQGTEAKESDTEKADAEKSGSGDKTTLPMPKPTEEGKITPGGDASGVGAAVDPAGAMADEAPHEDEADEIPRDETPQETAKRLGPPLVEQPDKLLRLDKVDSIWLDKPGGRLVMVGEVCQRQAPLEMFVCLWHTKEHEAVLTTRVQAKAAHAGLLALGAKVGNAVQFMPKYIPASGTVIDIEVIWKDKNGKIQKKRGQEWVRNFSTKKPMQRDWVFAGSGFWTDESTGKRHYQADSGDFICVSNFSTAMLDLPVESTQRNDGLMFEALTENIPPLGTPVTIVLKPRLGVKE